MDEVDTAVDDDDEAKKGGTSNTSADRYHRGHCELAMEALLVVLVVKEKQVRKRRKSVSRLRLGR